VWDIVRKVAAKQRRSPRSFVVPCMLIVHGCFLAAGEISLQQKGFLKDLIVDQDRTILAVAETFDAENDLNDVGHALSHHVPKL
jgi:hypothetical protein